MTLLPHRQASEEDGTMSHAGDNIERLEPRGPSRKEFLKQTATFGALALGAGVLVGCGTAASSPKAKSKNGTLIVASPDDLIDADPAFSSSDTDNYVQQAVFEGLQNYVPNGTAAVENRLAESLSVSASGLEVHFRLKQGVMFHKGFGECTAQDVKFSFERIAGILKPNLNSPYSGNWLTLTEVQVLNKYEGVIVLSKPFAPLLDLSIPYISGFIVSEKAVKTLGKTFAREPVGTGPYEFVSWTPGQQTVLKRFEGWHGRPLPDFAEIIFKPITDEQTKLIGLQTGALDAAPLDYTSIKRANSLPGVKVHAGPTLNYSWIGMNQLHPNLTDINVRQAIRYAIDVPSMLKAGYADAVQRATAVLAPKMPVGYWRNAPVYNQDLDRAKAYLKRATTVPKNLTFTTYLTSPAADTIAQIAAANLADIGLNVSILTKPAEETGTFLQDQQLFYGTFTGIAPDPFQATTWFTCSQFNQWNWQYWCNKQADQLQNAALYEIDPAKRGAMYVEWQRLWNNAVNTVWLAWIAFPVGYLSSQVKPAFYVWGDPATWAFQAV
jgi:peptide/nickel transport system substrate-binding protein